MSDLTDLGACELAATIRERRASSREVVQAFLARIERLNGPINAIVSLDEEGALRKAQQADEARARGERVGPLHGVPVTLKDCHATAGIRTTAGHPPLDQVPTRDGVIAARLRGAGAIILGKTNVSRLLQDIQADNPIFGRTSNPWDLTRTSGGSSGGAAAALAARLTPLDVGSDFAGSIRIPAHFCGVFGLKPTEHRVSMAGQLPELSAAARAPSLWSCGPMARSVDDLDLGLRVIAGADGSPEIPPVPAPQRVPMESKDLRIAWAPSFPGVPVQKAIRVALESLCNRWSNEGARLEERLPQISFEEQAKVRVCLAKAVDAPGSVSAADYFQALAFNPTNRAPEMILVVNKMDRVQAGMAANLAGLAFSVANNLHVVKG